MKIYTKTGDAGDTSLYGGERISKDSDRIVAYGTVDELNASCGSALALECPEPVAGMLRRIQSELFILGADLATPLHRDVKRIPRLSAEHVERLERDIDTLELHLPRLTAFIVPGGSAAGAQLHMCRTVCRRAERAVVTLASKEEIGPVPVAYLNRLSDCLFVMARFVNKELGAPEVPWMPEGA